MIKYDSYRDAERGLAVFRLAQARDAAVAELARARAGIDPDVSSPSYAAAELARAEASLSAMYDGKPARQIDTDTLFENWQKALDEAIEQAGSIELYRLTRELAMTDPTDH